LLPLLLPLLLLQPPLLLLLLLPCCVHVLCLQFKRFTKNNFFIEKNPTLVTFPVKNLDLKEALPVPAGVWGGALYGAV
jgi:hypothetical protein